MSACNDAGTVPFPSCPCDGRRAAMIRCSPMRHLLIGLGAVAVAIATVSSAAPAARACMPGAWHPQQDVLIYWHDGTEVLVWRTLVSTDPPLGANVGVAGSQRTANAPFAWLLAVPSEPIAFEVMETEDFEGVVDWASSHVVPDPPGAVTGGGRGFGEGALDVGETQRVGEYDVTPIRGTGDAAGEALAEWLSTNHFPAANADAVREYVAASYTFLAVKARMPARASRAKLRPLAIAFRSDRIVIPVKLSVGEPAFGLTATIFASQRPDVTGARHGLAPQGLYAPGAPRNADAPAPHVVEVPDLNYASVARRVPELLAARVPAMERMKVGPVFLARLRASPLTIDPNAPDPVLTLAAASSSTRAEQPEAETPSAMTESPPARVVQRATPEAAEETSSRCAVSHRRGGWDGMIAFASLLALVLLRRRSRRRRLAA